MKNVFSYLCDIAISFYKRKHNLLIKPRFINFLLTYNCNARCKMCNIWAIYQKDPAKAREELTLKEIEKFLIDNKRFLSSLIHIGFTGGDPLLMRDDFVDVVRIFRKYLPHVCLGVQTNGLDPQLAKKKLEEIISFYPEFSLAVSLDGVKDTHSKIRGLDGSFDNAVKTINYAKQIGIKRITCGMTLTKYNYQEIIMVKSKVEQLGCEFSCFLAEETEYFNNRSKPDNYSLLKEHSLEIAQQLQNSVSDNYFMDNLRLKLQGKRKPKVLCYSGFTSFVIDPYGNVRPCILKVKGVEDDVFGNIKMEKLKDMLIGEKANKIKQKIKKCSCWCQCEVTGSAMMFPSDVLYWFLFYCKNRWSFLKNSFKKTMGNM